MVNFKKYLPKWLSYTLRYFISIVYVMNDYLFILKAGFHKDDIYTLEKTLTEYYHAIEKGLIKKDFRPGFGQKKIDIIMKAILSFEKNKFSTDNLRYLTALSVLQSYIEKNTKYNFDVPKVIAFVEKRKTLLIEDLGGIKEVYSADLIKNNSFNFGDFAQNRVSVREFGQTPISLDVVYKAVEESMHTPSVCNRQGWFIKIIRNRDLLKSAINLQGGFNGHGENIQYLILVTANKKYFRFPSERNQAYIDGGLFSMSLLYALTSKNIATCSLNSNLTLRKRKKLSKLLNLQNEEALIMFIAVGSYPEKIITTKSARDSYLSKTVVYD